MTGPTIREATLEDAPALASLYRASYGRLVDAGFPTSAAETDEDEVRGWLSERDCWVAVDDGALVASIQLRDRPEWPCPEVCRLAVDPERHREGIGATLLGHAEGVVADRGHTRLRLRSFTDHPFLLDWYEERGYRQIDLQILDGRPFDVPVMERTL